MHRPDRFAGLLAWAALIFGVTGGHGCGDRRELIGIAGGHGGITGAGGVVGTGGVAGTGGKGDGMGGTTTPTWPCDGTTNGYDAVVTVSGDVWTARSGATDVHSGSDMTAAIQAAVDSLTPGRTAKQSVLVQGAGSMGDNQRVVVPSYTVLNVCGTMNVTSAGGSGDMAPLYALGQHDVEIPNITITGSPRYTLLFRDIDNLILGHVDARVSAGRGIRIDNHGRADRTQKVQNVHIDSVYAEGGAQGVETYGVNHLTVGALVARRTTEGALVLNDTTNAEIGTIDAIDAALGTGFAAFQMSNTNGRIDGQYPTNIHVGQIIARGGGRGISCLPASGGVVIDRVDLANTGSQSIFINNCTNVNIAALGGTVSRGGEIRVAARSDYPNNRDITLQNLTIDGVRIMESPCADNSVFSNITLLGGAEENVCP